MQIGEFGLQLRRAHIGPDEAAALDAWIGGDLDLALEVLVPGLARQIDAIAFDVEFPAVIDPAQAAFLVAAEEQRRGAMRAALIDEADAALRIAESDELLAE